MTPSADGWRAYCHQMAELTYALAERCGELEMIGAYVDLAATWVRLADEGFCEKREAPRDPKVIVDAAYPRIAGELLKPLLKFMGTWREISNGDPTKVLILLVVMLRTATHREFSRRTQEEWLSGEVPVLPVLRTNASTIADVLGMPKETVRRRVAELIEMGWLVRDEGKLHLTALAYQELTPLRRQYQALAVRCHDVIADLLSRPGRWSGL